MRAAAGLRRSMCASSVAASRVCCLTTRLCSVTEISPYGAQSERCWRAITMAPSESYQHVVKGGLKFKGGGGLPTAGGVKKKKKKDKKVRSTPAPLGRQPSPIPPEISPLFPATTRTRRETRRGPSSSPRATKTARRNPQSPRITAPRPSGGTTSRRSGPRRGSSRRWRRNRTRTR